jgi:hypothetical protein
MIAEDRVVPRKESKEVMEPSGSLVDRFPEIGEQSVLFQTIDRDNDHMIDRLPMNFTGWKRRGGGPDGCASLRQPEKGQKSQQNKI